MYFVLYVYLQRNCVFLDVLKGRAICRCNIAIDFISLALNLSKCLITNWFCLTKRETDKTAAKESIRSSGVE